MKTVEIYSTPSCHFCHMAKEYFKEHNIAYTDYDVATDLAKREEMMDKSGQLGVPVIVINDQDVVVGFDQRRIASLLGVTA
jgi:glutaredoxin 3